MQNLEQLSLALRKGTEGQAELARLDEEYTDARTLRDAQGPKVNKYGTVSPFAIMANMVDKSRGRRDMRMLEPQRVAAREAVAQNKNALPLWNAQRAQEADVQTQANSDRSHNTQVKQFRLTQAAAVEAAKQKAAAEQARQKIEDARHAAKQGARSTDATYYTSDTTGEKLKAYRTHGGDIVDSEGTKIDSLKGWTVDPKTTMEAGGYLYGNKKTDGIAVDTAVQMGAANRVGEKLNSLSTEAKDQLNSMGLGIREFLIDTVTPQKANALIKRHFSGYSDEAKDFLVSISRMSADERHALFGAALTGGEEIAGGNFLAGTQGLNVDQMFSRAADVYQKGRNNLESLDNVFGSNKYRQIITRSKWGAFNEEAPRGGVGNATADAAASPPPPASFSEEEKKQWGQYTPAQQAAYIKTYGAD